MGARNLTRDFHRVLDGAGLRQQRFHDLRHATVSLLVSSGSGLSEVKELLGHSDVRLTSNTYTHLFDTAKVKAMGRLESRGC